MSTATSNILKMPKIQSAKAALNLPEPRVWTPQHLSKFLSVSVSWIYKRTAEDAEDPIPRVKGVGRLRFDTANPLFQDWMRRQLGYVDIEGSDE
jgi:hypothetical protein